MQSSMHPDAVARMRMLDSDAESTTAWHPRASDQRDDDSDHGARKTESEFGETDDRHRSEDPPPSESEDEFDKQRK